MTSFLLDPVFDEQGELRAVCVTDVRPLEPQDKRTVIIGGKDFKPDYSRPDYRNNDGHGNDYSTKKSYDIEYDHKPRY